MFAALIPALTGILGNIIDSVFPSAEDEAKRTQAKNQLALAIMQNSAALEQASADIVKAEVQGQSWLQRNWRPICMLFFMVLIAARWFGVAAPNMSPEEYLKLWDLVQIGMGGYMIGRSAEKIIPAAVEAIKR
jgi:hypothetical protein